MSPVRSARNRRPALPAWATTPVPSPDTNNPADHAVRFTYGVPSSSEILRRRNPKNSLPDRHFRASTRRKHLPPVNDPGLEHCAPSDRDCHDHKWVAHHIDPIDHLGSGHRNGKAHRYHRGHRRDGLLLRLPAHLGSNENADGLLRQYFPTGTSLNTYIPDYPRAVAYEIKNVPRGRSPSRISCTYRGLADAAWRPIHHRRRRISMCRF